MKHANSNILFFLKPKVEIAYIYDYHTRLLKSWSTTSILPFRS